MRASAGAASGPISHRTRGTVSVLGTYSPGSHRAAWFPCVHSAGFTVAVALHPAAR